MKGDINKLNKINLEFMENINNEIESFNEKLRNKYSMAASEGLHTIVESKQVNNLKQSFQSNNKFTTTSSEDTPSLKSSQISVLTGNSGESSKHNNTTMKKKEIGNQVANVKKIKIENKGQKNQTQNQTQNQNQNQNQKYHSNRSPVPTLNRTVTQTKSLTRLNTVNTSKPTFSLDKENSQIRTNNLTYIKMTISNQDLIIDKLKNISSKLDNVIIVDKNKDQELLKSVEKENI